MDIKSIKENKFVPNAIVSINCGKNKELPLLATCVKEYPYFYLMEEPTRHYRFSVNKADIYTGDVKFA